MSLLKKAKNKFREKKGIDDYINVIILVFCLCMALALFVSTTIVMAKKIQNLNAGGEVVKVIENDGYFNAAEQTKVQQILLNDGISATVSCSVTGQINLGESFVVTISNSATMGVGSLFSTIVPVGGNFSGQGQVYWKS